MSEACFRRGSCAANAQLIPERWLAGLLTALVTHDGSGFNLSAAKPKVPSQSRALGPSLSCSRPRSLSPIGADVSLGSNFVLSSAL